MFGEEKKEETGTGTTEEETEETGYIGDTVCAVCGKIVEKGEAIDKKVLAKPTKVIAKSRKKSRDASGYEIQYVADQDFRMLKQ